MVDLRKTGWVAGLTLTAWIASARGQTLGEQSPFVFLEGAKHEVVAMNDVASDYLNALPDSYPVQQYRIQYGQGGISAVAGTPVEVYRNTVPVIFVTNGVNRLIGDDISVRAGGGCSMTALQFAVFRSPSAPAPMGFDITQFAIWDRCPTLPGAAMLLDLLEGMPFNVPTNGFSGYEIDFTGSEFTLPESFWLAIAFSKSDAGWIGGAAPTIGFSEDVIHIDDPVRPGLRCNTVFTGDPAPYASTYAAILCAPETVQPVFIGYDASQETDVFYGGGPCTGGIGGCGDGINLAANCETAADNIKTIVNDCRLHSYQMNVAGLGGMFDMEFELYTDDRLTDPMEPRPGVPIPGTRGCFHGRGTGVLEQARFTFDGSVTLPERFWLVWADTDADAGPIAARGAAQTGDSELVPGVEAFEVFEGGVWDAFVLPGCDGGDCTNFQIRVTCYGIEPVGACCERMAGTCRDELFVADCRRDVGRWLANTTCETAPFDPPCGVTGCCQVDPGNVGMSICSDEFINECTTMGGESVPGVFCDEITSCGIPACIAAQGGCETEHEGPGCFDNTCCNVVCRTDAFCCDTDWDSNCVGLADALCNDLPPENNACGDAIDIALGMTAFDTMNADTDGPLLPEDCESAAPNNFLLGRDIWYRFTAMNSGRLNIDLCGDQEEWDSRIAFYQGCTCPVDRDPVACNDDCDMNNLRSGDEAIVSANTCYLLRVGGWGEGALSFGPGEITLTFMVEACPPTGTVAFLSPPAGTVDARAPHPIHSLMPRQGIQSFTVQAPAEAGTSCFERCETDDGGNPNNIQTVTNGQAGVYHVNLSRTITTGAVTSITYTGTDSTGFFTAQPGNVNGIGGANAADVLALRDCLNGINPAVNCPHNAFSWDLDHSQGRGVLDLMMAVNLLIGSDTLDATNGQPQPSGAGCPN